MFDDKAFTIKSYMNFNFYADDAKGTKMIDPQPFVSGREKRDREDMQFLFLSENIQKIAISLTTQPNLHQKVSTVPKIQNSVYFRSFLPIENTKKPKDFEIMWP